MTESGKTHQDNVARIGGTAATAQGFMARRWNRYYFRALKQTVEHMLAGEIGASATVLNIGTSHGNWQPFLRRLGFSQVVGVELDARRAELARQAGYDEVYNSDPEIFPGRPRALTSRSPTTSSFTSCRLRTRQQSSVKSSGC